MTFSRLDAMVQPRRIGLTGGIATGKSTVGRVLAERHGLAVLDADQMARDALAPGTAASQAVLNRYGPAVLASAGSPEGNPPAQLDRQALARIVFADPAERQWLEHLVHPLVRAGFQGELERLKAAPVVVLMIPLLFEAGLESLCSEIWVADCGSGEEQLRRLQARDGLTRGEALVRMGAQWPMAEKLARADVVISTLGSPLELAARVDAALGKVPSGGSSATG
ncbi:MAG: dephospho-CoA kinase [Cyanobacteriota bacterium]|nr:dephospho-CoA kinase [Cyanobacteriota bacterium]